MGNSSSNITGLQRSTYNDIISSQSSCTLGESVPSDTQNVTFFEILVNNNFFKGNTTTRTDGTCLLVGSTDKIINNTLASLVNQKFIGTTDIYGGIEIASDTKKFDVKQSVLNNINNVNNTLCAANNIISSKDNYSYLTDKGGFIGYSMNSDNGTACALDNVSRLVAYNQIQASQSHVSVGVFTALAFNVMIIFIIMGAMVVLFLLPGKKEE